MYIKQVELSHFKSFGGTVSVPLLEGFTVISGPNGSGKSNILDALLFALGLSSSKGMRAERLPDLVNQAYSSRSRSTVEASVSVTFDLSDLPDDIFADDDSELDSTSVDETVELLMNGSKPSSPLGASEVETPEGETPKGDESKTDQKGPSPNAAVNGSNVNGSNGSAANGSNRNGTAHPPEATSGLENGVAHPSNGSHGHSGLANGTHNGHHAPEAADQNAGADDPAADLENPSDGSELPGADADDASPSLLPLKEWTVTRRLRVTPQGTYTSAYMLNGESCTLTQLHEQLQRCRIYPEGYNVVLQGDVTSIISMNSKERRGIIDELAGVAAFDRRINQAKEKLDAVQEREERFRIVEQELTEQRDRLAKDRLKAEKYQKLRTQFQEKTQWEGVMIWRDQQKQLQALRDRLTRDEKKLVTLNQQRGELDTQIKTASAELDTLNAKVRALGEDEQLALQSTLATQEAEQKQLQRQQSELATATATTTQQLAQSDTTIKDHRQTLEALQTAQTTQATSVDALSQECDQLTATLTQRRQAADEIASASDAWVQEQAKLRHEIDDLLKELDPLRTEQVRLQERIQQLEQRIQTQTGDIEVMSADLAQKKGQQTNFQSQHQSEIDQVQSLVGKLAAAEQELQIQQDTKNRLLDEQRQKQRELDKLEAQTQAQQESQGTYATKILLQTGLPGVCGLVAQLGRADDAYQQALEIAAGGRLGFLVVEDDRVASAGIRLLKEKRAGRATFLPLNKIRAPKVSMVSAWKRPDGFIDYAVNLIECDRDYEEVFAFVFGGTVVFESLAQARSHMGKFRMVTLDGELLEMSGAMTGGSLKARQGSLHFGTVEAGESAEAIALRERLHVIERILDRCEGAIAQATVTIKETTDALGTTRQQQQEVQFTFKQLNSQIEEMEQQIEKGRSQLSQDTQTLGELVVTIAKLEQTVPQMEANLQQKRQQLNELEQSQTHSEWQQAQAVIRECEQALAAKQNERRTVEQQLQEGVNQQNRLEEKIQATEQRIQEYHVQQEAQKEQGIALTAQLEELNGAIAKTKAGLATLEQTLSEEKKERDRAEKALKEQQDQHQQTVWNIEKIQERYQETIEGIAHQQQQVEESQAELPDPIPEIPEELTLEDLQKELRSLQRRMQSLEPVNMLALEEYERTQERLEELSGKLSTLDEERTELLLRIENFTTLRCRAFKEAFDAVNINFQSIFAELSDGDGYLQLDDPQDPFNGGLNLVAHPKGKPVRRLASMSGGEKSLTALSFIFALQRYRPSPFYAFDEVDMFLDGANVERLAKMIRKQAAEAQFIVVSLRRPMIEKADRTIGVTQARGAYTQVLGINLQQTK